MAKDPVCGMSVDETGAMHAERGGTRFFFCSEHCRTTFLTQLSSTTGQNDTRVEHSENDPRHRPPESAGTRNAGETSRHTTYTCPMHPEIEQDHPGDCPKCGMALEPTTVTAGTDDEEHAERRDMTRRFWIGAALTLPVFVLAMAHVIPALSKQSWVDGHICPSWSVSDVARRQVCS